MGQAGSMARMPRGWPHVCWMSQRYVLERVGHSGRFPARVDGILVNQSNTWVPHVFMASLQRLPIRLDPRVIVEAKQPMGGAFDEINKPRFFANGPRSRDRLESVWLAAETPLGLRDQSLHLCSLQPMISQRGVRYLRSLAQVGHPVIWLSCLMWVSATTLAWDSPQTHDR